MRNAYALLAALLLAGCGDGGEAGDGAVSPAGQAGPASGMSTAAPPSTISAGSASATTSPDPGPLPDITTFREHPSSWLPADVSRAAWTIPFLGKDAQKPHSGLHIHWSNADRRWPATPGRPTSYPAIYAVADGVVEHVDRSFAVGSNDRYGILLRFATENGAPVYADYSIEPFIPEPRPGFYQRFLAVREGQRVSAGDVIAYMYVPATSTGETHLHFDLWVNNTMQSPSIFDRAAVKRFAATFDPQPGTEGGAVLPACIGWKVTAAENPFGTGAARCL